MSFYCYIFPIVLSESQLSTHEKEESDIEQEKEVVEEKEEKMDTDNDDKVDDDDEEESGEKPQADPSSTVNGLGASDEFLDSLEPSRAKALSHEAKNVLADLQSGESLIPGTVGSYNSTGLTMTLP